MHIVSYGVTVQHLRMTSQKTKLLMRVRESKKYSTLSIDFMFLSQVDSEDCCPVLELNRF